MSDTQDVSKPKILDVYCCQGGMSMGFSQVGFAVHGVDLEPQPRYPFPFTQADALAFLRWVDLSEYVAIHASPPCQHDSNAQRIQDRDHPDLIGPTRELLELTGLPYIIENVGGAVAKLRDPIMICGPSVGVDMYRHRFFETNWHLPEPQHLPHNAPQVKMGRRAGDNEFIQAVGNFSGVQRARDVMEMQWANRDGLREAIPPAYARYVGQHLMDHLRESGRIAT